MAWKRALVTRLIGRALIATAAILLSDCATPRLASVDLLIRGGTIYTGSDAPFDGDVAVDGDRIHAVAR
ncbi:MAG: hypothetical protein M3438_11040, partial [Pseudomonadota bacterium]|nr:hypothetical protein [Pseudomonadota bacterium]